MTPSIRGNQLKANWAMAQTMAKEASATGLGDAIAAEHIVAIEQCGRLAWVPLRVDVALSQAVESVLGEGADYTRSRRSTSTNMDSTLMKPFLDGARRLFGLDPRAALKLIKPGWTTVFRGCGEANYRSVSATESLVRFDGLPEMALGTPSYVGAIAGSLHGLLDVCEVEGATEVLETSVAKSELVIRVTWEYGAES